LKPESERYKRFGDEQEQHRALGTRQGILPLLDCYLPKNPTRDSPAWLSTPVARPVKEVLGTQAKLETVVEAVACIAETLASLEDERQLYHRDLKPNNLFFYN